MQMEWLGGKARGIMHIASHAGSLCDEVDVHGDSKINIAAKDKDKKRPKSGEIVQQVKKNIPFSITTCPLTQGQRLVFGFQVLVNTNSHLQPHVHVLGL